MIYYQRLWSKSKYAFNAIISYVRYSVVCKRYGFKTIILSPLAIVGAKYMSIGKCCFIHKNARIEAVSFYENVVYTPNLIMEDGVFIQQNFHCTCAHLVKIGRGTSITANVGIFDIIHPYENIDINPRNQSILTKDVIIGESCMVGMNSVILPGTILGKHCVVGANSVVSGVFDDYYVIVCSPARVVKKYNKETREWIHIKL